MKIGVDLDDTLSQTMSAIVNFHNNTYGTNLVLEKLKDGASYKSWGGTLEDDIKKIHDFHLSPYGLDLPTVKGAYEVLKKLKKNNELYIITARNDDIRKDTEEWVNKNYPNIFTGIYFTNHFANNSATTTKRKVCDDLDIDIFIDDNLQYVIDCIKQNRKAYLMDYPWNENGKLPEGVKRIYSWKEIDELENI